jgi:hypothetical protein
VFKRQKLHVLVQKCPTPLVIPTEVIWFVASGDGALEVWKLDLWRAPYEEFEAAAGAKRQLWQSLLNDETRSHILLIKDKLCRDPRYRKTLLSVHIYEAVLEYHIRGLDQFEGWWQARRTAV